VIASSKRNNVHTISNNMHLSGNHAPECPPMTWLIIWPVQRRVSEQQIKLWYSDAVANGETEGGLNDADEMARELHYIGTITLGRDC
jgi:hypothetical protein